MNELTKRNIKFSPPDITEAEIDAVAQALRSGWITTGPRTKLLEERIAEYCNTYKSVCLNSATAALELTLRILGIGAGDEVIVPAYTYTATASVVCHVGATLVIVDTQKDCLEFDYDALSDAVTSKTKAIIAVDVAGLMCDYDKLFDIVLKKRSLYVSSDNDIQKALSRIAVISDSAHGLGAKRNGVMSGNVADFTAFSFHAVKNFTTGEGGAVTWRNIDGIDNDWLYKQFMLASLHGQTKDALAKSQIGAWEYDILYPAYKCNMTDFTAAIGIVQLERYESLLARRKEIINKYNAAFVSLGAKVLDHYNENNESSGHLYMMQLPTDDINVRNQFIIDLAERGIAANVHYKPLPLLTAYKNLGFDIKDYPNSYSHFVSEVTLPLHTLLTDEDVEYVINNTCELLAKL